MTTFGRSIREIYPSELELEDTTLNSKEVCYLDIKIGHGDSRAPFHIDVYDKREDFNFWIVSISLSWTVTFLQIRRMVFTYLNW